MSDEKRKILFFDCRHIQCGNLVWKTDSGEQYDVAHPPGDPVPMHVDTGRVPHGLRIEAQPADKHELVAEWQGWGRVIYEGGVYKNWQVRVGGYPLGGTGSPSQMEKPPEVEICALESDDGNSWKVKHQSEINVPGQNHFDGQTFFVDPVGPPSERYKIVYHANPPGEVADRLYKEYTKRPPLFQDERIVGRGKQHCIFAAVSPDGLDWKSVPEPLMMHSSDTDTTVYYEEGIRKYVLYTRMYRHDRRWVGRAESEDFFHWEPIHPLIWPSLSDPMDDDVYLNGFSRYPGCSDYRLMFPMFYHRYNQRSDVRLCSSDDGMAWHMVPGSPVISCGEPESDKPESMIGEFITGGKDLVPYGDGRLAIPYASTPYPHKYPRWPQVFAEWKAGWASWPEDRLSALKADREGVMWTLPLPAGKQLWANFRTGMSGEIRVGIEGVEGRSAVDCDPLHGDSSGQKVTWKNSADPLAGENAPVSLNIRMRDAELFCLEWK